MPDPSLRQLLRQLWGYLGRRRRWQLGPFSDAGQRAEVLSLAAVLPFQGGQSGADQSLVQQ